jgi:hypothetical protein
VAAVESHRRHLGVIDLIRDRITAAGHLAAHAVDRNIIVFRTVDGRADVRKSGRTALYAVDVVEF